MFSIPALFLFALFTSAQPSTASPAVPHPGLWERYRVYGGLVNLTGPGTSLIYEPVENRIYGQFGDTLWGGAPFDAEYKVVADEDLPLLFTPTRLTGNFSRLFYLNGTLILIGDVMSWLGFEPSKNTSGWFARDTRNPWPVGYVFTGLAYGNVAGNITVPMINGTSENGTWVCLRKAASTSVDMATNESYFETVLSSGALKQICTDNNATILNFGRRQPVIHDVIFAEGMFVAVGHNPSTKLSSVLTSTDGIEWEAVEINGETAQAQGIVQTLTRIRYGGGWFVAVGFQSCCIAGATNSTDSPRAPPPLIVTSPDGVTWTRYQFPEPYLYAALTDAVWNGQAWVAVGEGTFVGMDGQWQAVYWHINNTGLPFVPPVPPLDNLLYLPAENLYYATAGPVIFVAKSLAAGQECNVSNDCSGRVLLPPYEDVRVCSPRLHACVECAADSDCPEVSSFCNTTGGNFCSKRVASSAFESCVLIPFLFVLSVFSIC